MMCGCEEKAEVGAVMDHGWVPNVTPGAPSWHKMVRHGATECNVLTHEEALGVTNTPVTKPEPVGRKDDFGKQRYDLIPFNALAQVVAVLTKGAEKYAPENWRLVDGWRWRYLGAALRHVAAFMRGEKLDPEWCLPHLAHAICCLMFALELDK